MPTLNGVGQRIPDLVLSPKEAHRVRFLSGLTFEEHYDLLKRLPHEDFKVWLYSQDPLVQLVRSGDERFKSLVKYQRYKSFSSKTFDFFWRLFHGLGY